MNIVLLSGGSGKRLWPLSNDIFSKQFIRIFKTDEGAYESMIQRVYRQIRSAAPASRVVIATGRSQIPAINNQIGPDVRICAEPCRRDTFPAIGLAASYLRDVCGVPEEEAVVICPVDPYVEESYFQKLNEMWESAGRGDANLVLMGIAPTYPSEKYGYIISQGSEEFSKVSCFKEKPDSETAAGYIAAGALWNGGVFACKIKYLMERTRELTGLSDYHELYQRYETLPKISFDYAVVEKEPDIRVMRYEGCWKDVGTWNTLSEVMEENCVGTAVQDPSCENVHIVNNLDIPILCMGLKDAVVSAGPDGILVSDKEQSSYIKPYVDRFDQQVSYAEKSWGSFRVIDVEDESMTIKITLNRGHRMNYHSHRHRDEVWTVISGSGRTVVDGMEQPVGPGDVVTIQAGCRHTIIADTELKVIEVQLGKEINVNDKQKFSLE